MCPCNGGAQSSEHLIYDCEILEIHRKIMKHKKRRPEKEPGQPPTENW